MREATQKLSYHFKPKLKKFSCFLSTTGHTSLGLFYCPKATTDSETIRPDMKKISIGPETPIYALTIPKIFRIYTYPLIEISTIFGSHTIIEYQIFCFIFPILEANLGQNYHYMKIVIFPIL